MKTYSLELASNLKLRDIPKHASIRLNAYTKDENGVIYITPHCVSIREIDYQIDRLHKELETIRRQAKRKFKSRARS